MGAKTWMLAYVEDSAADILTSKPVLDRKRAAALAQQLFPKEQVETTDDGNLAYTCPRRKELYVGCFPGVDIVAAREFRLDFPSKLPRYFIELGGQRSVYLHAMHSVADWFAYAIWRNGKLIRSLSAAPDNGVMEDIGERRPFELPYWFGQHPALGPEEEAEGISYPLPFHPLELGEAALLDLFGYQLEGFAETSLFDPETISLAGFKRNSSWWKFW